MGRHSPEIFDDNKRGVGRISNALAPKEAGKSRPVHTYFVPACNEIANLIDEQTSLVDEYIRTSPLTRLSRALKIQNLATRCMILAKLIRQEKYDSDEPEVQKCEDLTLLRFHLQRLIST